MIREYILFAIYKEKMNNCSLEECEKDKNKFWGVACKECAEKDLVEYEKKIRADAIDECLEILATKTNATYWIEKLKEQNNE